MFSDTFGLERIICDQAKNRRYKIRVWLLLRGIYQRKPGLGAVPMGDDSDWRVTLPEHPQNNHLAFALLRAMVKA